LEIAKVGPGLQVDDITRLIDTSQAFESPLLADEHSNSSGRDLAKVERIGGAEVKYGATSQYGRPDQVKLAFANPVLVTEPQKGMKFDL
jgi:hypothetical protein